MKTRVYRLASELQTNPEEVLAYVRKLELRELANRTDELEEDAANAIRKAWRKEVGRPPKPAPKADDLDSQAHELKVLEKAPPKPKPAPKPEKVDPAALQASTTRQPRKDDKKKKKTLEALQKISGKKASAGIPPRSERLLEFTRRAGLTTTSAVYSRVNLRRRQPTRGGTRRRDSKGESMAPQPEEIQAPSNIDITLPITVRDLSQAMGMKANMLIAKLLELGVPSNVNAFLNDEEAVSVLGEEFNCTINVKKEEQVEEMVQRSATEDREEDREVRPPVVTFLGHVDHGKTSLLDAIRTANVTASEHGGITQHIRAYKVSTADGKEVVFLDTPGHEAFTEMRSRGANLTDTVVLVVAADDGVMPQTKEAVSHARAAEVPIVVALNKVDKPEANVVRVRQQLAELGLQSSEWGGSTSIVEVSATTKQGIDDLIEILALESEVLELRGNTKLPATGTVLEGQLTEGRGAVVTLLVQNGTLRRDDFVLCGQGFGKIRNMWNDQGAVLNEAGPATPVEITGLSTLPEAGDRFYVVKNQQEARELAERRQRELRDLDLAEKQHITLDNLYSKIQQSKVKEIRIVLKADVKGSLQVLKKTLTDLSTDEIKVKILYNEVGEINESDVLLADTSDAIVIGFHVLTGERARTLAEKKGVDVRNYHVIYNVTDEVRSAMEGMLDPEEKESVIGHVEIRQIFKASGLGNIAGCYVTDGKIERNSRVRVYREGKEIFEGALESLKRFKNDAKEVKEGFECGLRVAGYDDVKVADIVEVYEIQKVARKLT